MKRLDEVIKALEWCIDDSHADNCDGCPYDVTNCYDRNIDALHYLKEYRTTQTAYIKAMADLEDNPPLTFEEVREMVGMPVWMEWNYSKGWRLVNCFDSTVSDEKAVALTDRFGVDFVFSAETFAKCEVMVYRREKK